MTDVRRNRHSGEWETVPRTRQTALELAVRSVTADTATEDVIDRAAAYHSFLEDR